jgi:nicotinamide-nucleotide amidase
MKAEIISVGTEILLGEITDTNATYLAAQLPLLGIDLYHISAVGDNLSRLSEVLGRAWGHSDLVLTTGGLGPTEDDLTREAIAKVLGEEMKVDPALEKWLRDFFASRSYAMPERNLKQATLIPSAQALPNPRGTAPGWWVEREGKIIVAMPGPPMEMNRMWENEVVPRLKGRLGGEVILSRTLKSFGIGEASVDEMVSPHLGTSNPSIGVYSRMDGIHLRITAKAPSQEEARELLAEKEAALREILGRHIWGADDETLPALIGNLLTSRGLSLATMESCTGGLLSNTVTDVPGSSAYFKGGLVAYSNELKIAFGVDPQIIEQHGAVSPQTAEAMASAARENLKADVGLGVTGVAGPAELEGKPAGTVHIAIDAGGKTASFSHNFPFPRLRMKLITSIACLFRLREVLHTLD